jgi:acyl-CoA thioester hydrolase
MPAIFEYRHCVRADEIDALGHANNLAYLAWMQAAALAHSAAQGWPGEDYHRLGSGWVVRSHRINYMLPAFASDELVVRTWVATMKKASSLRRYDAVRPADGKTLAQAATDWAFVDFTTGLPRRVPGEIRQAFELVENPADHFVSDRKGRYHVGRD